MKGLYDEITIDARSWYKMFPSDVDFDDILKWFKFKLGADEIEFLTSQDTMDGVRVRYKRNKLSWEY